MNRLLPVEPYTLTHRHHSAALEAAMQASCAAAGGPKQPAMQRHVARRVS
jgi:hypothetical protein